MTKKDKQNLQWKVHTPRLLKEILNNPTTHMLATPLNILHSILGEVAKRATELDDIKLNQLMMRLALYEIAEPTSPDYDSKFVSEYLSQQPDPKGENKNDKATS